MTMTAIAQNNAIQDYEMSAEDQAILLQDPLQGNQTCMDCQSPNPRWVSLSFAIVLCNDCCGIHRSLGTHISFCRSIDMDAWTPEQLQIMKVGGNAKCTQFFQQHGVLKAAGSCINSKEEATQTRKHRLEQTYASPVAQLYKQVLKARAEGTAEPTELPNNTLFVEKRKVISTQGFGSSPPPSDKKKQWVAVPVLLTAASVGAYLVSSALSSK